MLQRIPIALAQVKAGNTPEDLLMKSNKLYIPCMKKKELLKNCTIINEFNKVIKQNEYYIYEF